jgi:S-disulfanyl-L-cysteine oxidoreductase SoxD
MSFEWDIAAILVACTLVACTPGVGAAQAEPIGRYGLGHVPDAAEIAAWDIDVRADGAGLPNGRGSVSEGKAIFAEACAACHGDKGQGQLADALVGGGGTLNTAKPLKTVGSFWPYATTLYDYVHRAMPFNAPQSLAPEQVYAVTAYVLYLNGIVPEDATLDAASLPKIQMPNRNGFVSDPRPDVAPTPK